MAEQEGVIKFDLVYTRSAPLPPERLRELNAWRKMLYQLELLGQDPVRYGGVSFGNVSQRIEPFDRGGKQARFVVTGTQTGRYADLNEWHYAIVNECDPELNRTIAEGPIQPSSESLTHGMLYSLDDSLRFVFHVHSPAIWRHAHALGLPVTDEGAAYGTPEMTAEVQRLFRDGLLRENGMFVMAGHEDGLVSFGRTAEAAGIALLRCLARALQF